jgi:hypothetical protein
MDPQLQVQKGIDKSKALPGDSRYLKAPGPADNDEG